MRSQGDNRKRCIVSQRPPRRSPARDRGSSGDEQLSSLVFTVGGVQPLGVRVMRYEVYASALAATLLIGSIGTAFAQTTVGGTGTAVGAVQRRRHCICNSWRTRSYPPKSAPSPNVSFFTDPLSVGPSQIPPTGPIGSDPQEYRPNCHQARAVPRRQFRAPPAARHAAFRIASRERTSSISLQAVRLSRRY